MAVQKSSTSAPTFLVIISWLVLIEGILASFGILPALLIGLLGKHFIFLLIGLLILIKGVGFIVLSFGLRKMRKWALYVYTILAIISICLAFYNFITTRAYDGRNIIVEVIGLAILAYLWSNSKKFS